MILRPATRVCSHLVLALLVGTVAWGASAEERKAERGRAKAMQALLEEAIDTSIAGIDRRLGGVAPRPKSKVEDQEPLWYLPPDQPGKDRVWQVGGPWRAEAGDYSSTQGQVLYAPERGAGIDRVNILEMGHNCFTQKPLPPWWGNFRPDPDASAWLPASGSGVPLAIARGIINWSNCGVLVCANGLIATAGTHTAKGGNPTVMLPKGVVPTSLCVLPKSEFALVTVCDVKRMQGGVAVIALTSNGGKRFVHEWQLDHPGLPSVALITGMKLLGVVDLPGIVVPTAISAVGDRGYSHLRDAKGNNAIARDIDLSLPAMRASFLSGGNSAVISASGWAVVAARGEDKVAFLDLQPLFARYREMYFTTPENWTKTRDQGPADGQWPHTFTHDPSARPQVAGVVPVDAPTAILAGLGLKDQACAYIATRDGRVLVVGVGGLAGEAPFKDGDLTAKETVTVGANITCLAYQKGSRDTVLAVSRGERAVAWLKTAAEGTKEIRRLRDQRLIDPVHVEVSDTHGIETALLTVCDFRGRKLVNYRYGELKFVTNGGAKFGMGKNGTDPFECGGLMELPGCPFAISATNVN